MHALKNYSDSSNSDVDDQDTKRVNTQKHVRQEKYTDQHKKREKIEHCRRIKYSPSRCKREHEGSYRSSKSSHSGYKDSDRSHKTSCTTKESSRRYKTDHVEKDYSKDKKRTIHTTSTRRDRSRSRSPDRGKSSEQSHQFSSKTKEPIVSTIPALAQAQAASALLSARLSQTSQAQLQLNRARQESIEEKRKKLWSSKKKTPASQSQWDQATFSEGDGQTQAKFRRLMGMSSANKEKSDKETTAESGEDQNESSDVMKNLEQQYESSRYLTHMARGYGLGYGYSSTPDSADLDK